MGQGAAQPSSVDNNILACVEFLVSPQVHLSTFEKRHDVWVECFPVGVFQVILLTAFLLVAFDYGKVPLIVDGSHDEPGDGLFVLRVDAGSLDELVFNLGQHFGLGRLGPEVDDEGVNHCGRTWMEK